MAVLGAGFLTLANAQTVSGTATGGTTPSGKHGFMQNLTDAQKAAMQQAKTLFDAGKKDEAKALLQQNGITIPEGGHSRGRMHMDMRKVDEAIANGDFATFQNLASTTPLGKVDQATFNLLTPEFKAKMQTETNIQSILKNAGIEFGPHSPNN